MSRSPQYTIDRAVELFAAETNVPGLLLSNEMLGYDQ